MDDNAPEQNRNESEVEALKKTTRISLEEALSARPPPKKATTSLIDRDAEKKATSPITGIPTHTAPIPQTIRLKRPATSPIVINPPDITTAPTVVKTVHPKPSTSAISETATVVKRPVPPMPLKETSRIIIEIGPQAPEVKQKTAPLPPISPTEPTPTPKTIRLKRPSTIIAAAPPEEKEAVPSEMQAVKKSETAKIELPKDLSYQAPSTQRKTIKIKRTDRNVIPRTVALSRPPETKPAVEAALQKEEAALKTPVQEESLPVFPILAGLAVICLALLVYLLTAQAFGPKLLLPVPSGLF